MFHCLGAKIKEAFQQLLHMEIIVASTKQKALFERNMCVIGESRTRFFCCGNNDYFQYRMF